MTEEEKLIYLSNKIDFLSSSGKDYLKSLSQILLNLQSPLAELESLKADLEAKQAPEPQNAKL